MSQNQLKAESPSASPLPTGGYTDYILRSSAPSTSTGWRHNVMKFNNDKLVDPTADDWVKPVKLNRKDPRLVRKLTEEEREKIVEQRKKKAAEDAGFSMDVDQNEGETGDGSGVKKEEGAVKAEKEQIDLSLVGVGKNGLAPAKINQASSKGGKFKKKTTQTHVVSEESRRLNREEWSPWVLEDEPGEQRWIGRLEGGATAKNKPKEDEEEKMSATGTRGWRAAPPPTESGGGGSAYVAFVFGENGEDFKVVPVNRWYKFNRGPRYATLGTEEAEDEYNRQQKATEQSRWIMHQRMAASVPKPSPSEAVSTSASAVAPKAGASHSRLLSQATKHHQQQKMSDARPMTKFKSVMAGSEGNGNGDDEIGKGRARARGKKDEQEDGEFDYDEDFADDEEGIAGADDQVDEDEAKELDERIRKEMRSANNFEVPVGLDDDDEEDEMELTNAGREVKKIVKKRDNTGLYDSDDGEDDDYTNSEDDTRSLASLDLNGDKKPSQSAASLTRTSSQTRHNRPSGSGSAHPSRAGSRSGSPVPGAGAAVVAKRATSPRPSGSAGGKRSGSVSRSGSPAPGAAGKRKRTEGSGGDESDAAKRRKNGGSPAPSSGDGSNLLTEGLIIALLKTRPGASFTTQEVLAHFKKALKAEPKNKQIIGPLLQSVANLVGKDLFLKPGL